MYIKIKYLNNILKFIGLQALCSFGCFLFTAMFPGILEFWFGDVLYSVFTIFIWFDILFTLSWSLGAKHRRDVNIHNNHTDNPDEKITYSYISGVKLGALYAGFCLIIGIVTLIMDLSASPAVSLAGNLIFKMWFMEFIVGFKYIVRLYWLLWILISLFPFVPISLGFACGVKELNIIESLKNKIIYKN